MSAPAFTIISTDDAYPKAVQLLSDSQRESCIAICVESEKHRADARRQFPNAEYFESWDQLVAAQQEIPLVLAGVTESTVRAANMFIEVSLQPLYLLTNTSATAQEFFAFAGVAQDGGDRLVPVFDTEMSMVVEQFRKRTTDINRDGPIRIEMIRTNRDADTISQSEVDQLLFLDLHWLSELLGPIRDVTSLRMGEQGDSAREHVVQLAAHSGSEARWTVSSTESDAQWKLTIESNGHIYSASFNGTNITISVGDNQSPTIVELPLKSESTSNSELFPHQQIRNWNHVNQFGEIGAAVKRSLARRRTVAVQHEDATERNQFKSQMAAIGCGVLLWVMFGMIAMLVFGAAFDPRDREYKQSSSADFVVHSSEFKNDWTLTQPGSEHMTRIANQWSSSTPVLLIESIGEEQNEQRLDTVIKMLQEENIRDLETRVIVRALPDQWFEWIMWIGWAVVFGPLAVILVAQLLIVITR